MRTIKIPNCSYEKYSKIRDIIIRIVPFSIINDMYSKEEQIGAFNFWDSDYIPENLAKYIVQPPLHRERKDEMVAALAKLGPI